MAVAHGQRVLEAGEPLASARAAMILLHGRGATAEDILTIAAEVQQPGWAYLAPQAAGNARTHRMTAGGYDVGPRATVKELRDEARELNIPGRSRMNKDELKQAVMNKAGRRV